VIAAYWKVHLAESAVAWGRPIIIFPSLSLKGQTTDSPRYEEMCINRRNSLRCKMPFRLKLDRCSAAFHRFRTRNFSLVRDTWDCRCYSTSCAGAPIYHSVTQTSGYVRHSATPYGEETNYTRIWQHRYLTSSRCLIWLMPMTHSQISESKDDSENRPQKSVPIFEVDFSYRIHSGWKIGAENKHGGVQRKNYEFPV